MKKSALFTVTGNYWHFHLIGTGVIFTYHVNAKQVITTCELSGQIIETKDFYQEGGFNSPDEFRDSCRIIYSEMASVDGMTIILDYLDDPEIIESGEIFIGYDPKVILN